ncbi:tetratricopeptide repeat protein 39B-like isoform X3 [Portunus trituberculatus]|uniref:tetratricopeptide repeat protein 39B-like isoform X3 n=1 Tax=Portunus trituberculatus TaxID=210409 RepID=UPI001E1CED61|nr:tetratricopeptide repeat protein 39B-like isoform X3 [Portunus trituberculatus]
MQVQQRYTKVFVDAAEEVCGMDLSTAMEEARLACSYFFNNRFEEARTLMRPWAHKSMYHGLGYGTFMYLQAIMTFDPKDIETAIETLKQSVEVCNRFRRKNTIGESLGKMVKKVDYNSFTKEEIHAELCYAECLLLRAVLTFMEDETLISFLKGGMKIRACYQSYKECWYILEGRDWSKDADKMHFESGVRMGVGAFNLMISQLPQKILKLLEFVGFSGNKSCQVRDQKSLGLSELERGFHLEGSLRRVLCALVLLGYHLIATYVLGTSEGDLVMAQTILDDHLKLYPNGAWFLFFAARLEYVKGNFDLAIEKYTTSLNSQNEWRQFHHLCYWELMWCCIMSAQFKEGEEYADKLLQESKWSKATYAYQKASCMCMRMDELTPAEKQELSETMRSIPGLKQRIAGKSLPVEKFAVKKSLRFFAQGERLCLSALELIYAWNGIKILAKKYENIEKIYSIIERELRRLEKIRADNRSEYYYDDYLLANLLKGSCLAYMNSPLQAEECFKFIVSNEKKIKEDTYLVPNALLELGLLLLRANDLEQSRIILEHAKNNYKGYSLESRLHFRVHATLNKISTLQKGSQSVGSNPMDSYPSISRSPSPCHSKTSGTTNGTGPHLKPTKNGKSISTHP